MADLDCVIKDYVEDQGTVVSFFKIFKLYFWLQYYLIEVRLLAQIWILKRRYSDFDKMHNRLLDDLDYCAADNLPDLPAKRMFFNKDQEFVKERHKLLNKYLKFIILIYEAIENPIL